jgi:uncharacterized protein DUF2252
MNILEATHSYEAWLAKHATLLPADLALKHQRMAEGPFPFLRATFYRWMQLWPEVCSDLAAAPVVLAVGDLHVENFGTWRDAEGRLIWGINDFDEAFKLPYTVDLVRLAASADLAAADGHLQTKFKDACEAILSGYEDGLKSGGKPFVLAEDHSWLREMAQGELRDPVRFWEKMENLPAVKSAIPASAKSALEQFLPEPGLPYKLVRRVAGLGSLGRQRVVALADWRGGRVAREAKALAPSACRWANADEAATEISYQEILHRAIRVPDPCVHLQGEWLVRRLAPDCTRIELADLAKQRDEVRLLHAMGKETANIHLGTKQMTKEVLSHLRKRSANWLHDAGREMSKAVTRECLEWKKSQA